MDGFLQTPAYALRDDRARDSVIFRCLGHVQFQKLRIAQPSFLNPGFTTDAFNYAGRDGLRQKRRNGVADLPETMPFRCMKPEAIGIGMKSCGFTYGYAAWRIRMDRPWRSESAAVASVVRHSDAT